MATLLQTGSDGNVVFIECDGYRTADRKRCGRDEV